jgi:hypothetical protein
MFSQLLNAQWIRVQVLWPFKQILYCLNLLFALEKLTLQTFLHCRSHKWIKLQHLH